jgi:ABC-type thiamin/hydroxymethylpyrimidine transport system permease subunit
MENKMNLNSRHSAALNNGLGRTVAAFPSEYKYKINLSFSFIIILSTLVSMTMSFLSYLGKLGESFWPK